MTSACINLIFKNALTDALHGHTPPAKPSLCGVSGGFSVSCLECCEAVRKDLQPVYGSEMSKVSIRDDCFILFL